MCLGIYFKPQYSLLGRQALNQWFQSSTLSWEDNLSSIWESPNLNNMLTDQWKRVDSHLSRQHCREGQGQYCGNIADTDESLKLRDVYRRDEQSAAFCTAAIAKSREGGEPVSWPLSSKREGSMPYRVREASQPALFSAPAGRAQCHIV
jgi:hypothetical protein